MENSETIAPLPLRIFSASAGVFGRIEFHQTGANHSDRATFGGESALMCRGIDSASETADYRQPGVRELKGEFFRRFCSVMSGAARNR